VKFYDLKHLAERVNKLIASESDTGFAKAAGIVFGFLIPRLSEI